MEKQKEIIENFYARDDISVQAAGRKDTYVVDGEIVSKRFMLMTISEAYELYRKHIDVECASKSTFYNFRPKHIQISSKMPHNMCVCMYHENFGFLLEGCAKIIKSFSCDFQSFLK